MIYFDNAATTFPKPDGVHLAVREGLQFYGANPGRSGHKLSVQTARQVYLCREALAEMMGAPSAESVAFTQNCTHALNLCIKGLVRQGDHIIISDLEHNSVLRPVHTLQKRGIASYDVLTIHDDDEDTLKELRQLLKPSTRLIAITHGSNVFGIMPPVQKIAALAREQGIYFLLDAAQSAGVAEIDVQKMQIDFLCMPGHKGLYGPAGTGAIVTTRPDALATIIEGGTGSLSLEYEQPDFMPDMLESGTVNTLGIVGLKAGIDFVKTQGQANLYFHETALTAQAYDGLMNIRHAKLYTQRPKMGKTLPVLAFNIQNMSGEEVCELLDEAGFCLRGGFHCAPLAHQKMGTLDSGAARLSLGAFNTAAQVDQFLQIVNRMVR